MRRGWEDKVLITRQDFFDFLKAHKARIIIAEGDEQEEEITQKFFDILKEYRGDVR